MGAQQDNHYEYGVRCDDGWIDWHANWTEQDAKNFVYQNGLYHTSCKWHEVVRRRWLKVPGTRKVSNER